jgi:putative ABC transport system permease protein
MMTQRIKEIGIQKTNGANTVNLMELFSKYYIKWVMISFVIAVPISYYIIYLWLENYAYKTAISWWIFALAGLIAFIIAIITISWQIWKTAHRNPVEALRYE